MPVSELSRRPVRGVASKSDLASPGSLDQRAQSALGRLPASSPQLALRWFEESLKDAVDPARAEDYRVALASDFRQVGSLAILVGPESPMVLERSDSAESLSVYLARLAEHFRLAMVSAWANQTASFFRSVLPASRLAFRKASRRAKQQAFQKVSLQAGLVEPASNWANPPG